MNSPARGNKLMLYLMFYKLFTSYLLIATITMFNLEPDLITLIITSQILNFFVPFVVYKLIVKQSFIEILKLKPLNLKSTILIIFMSIVIQPAMMFISAVSSIFVSNDVSAIMQQLTAFPLALSILAIGVTPSIMEEIMFRGAVHNEYKNIDIKKAALVNGLFFGIMHMNLQQFVYAAVLGVFLTYFMHYTGSILAPMISHFVINSSQVMLGHFTFNAMDYIHLEELPEPNTLLSIIYIGTFALLLVPLFIFLFKELIDANKYVHKPPNVQEDGVSLTLEKGFDSYRINTSAFKGVLIFFVLYFAIGYFL